MSDEIMLVFGEDGVARKYDDTWDITIHCESEEEQKTVLEKLNNSNQEAKNSNESSSTHKALDTISRQAAIDTVKNTRKFCDTNNIDDFYDLLIEAFAVLPSAQPEIIHCRECQHHRRDNTGCYYCVRKDYGYGWGLNDFCSDAERRTDEDD